MPIPNFYTRLLGREITEQEWLSSDGAFLDHLRAQPVHVRGGAVELLTAPPRDPPKKITHPDPHCLPAEGAYSSSVVFPWVADKGDGRGTNAIPRRVLLGRTLFRVINALIH